MPQIDVTKELIMRSFIVLMPLAFIPAFIASLKGKSFIVWYVYSLLLFPVALIHAMLLKTPQLDAKTSEVLQTELARDFVIGSHRIDYGFLGCPLNTVSYVIKSNFALRKIVVVLNMIAEKKVSSFDVTLEMIDGMNRKIAKRNYKNVAYSDSVEFDISEYPYTVYVDFTVDKIAFENGEEWVPSGERIKYEIDALDGPELEQLRELTNRYAVCLPCEKDEYWVCSCSKLNDTDDCSLCGMGKDELFAKVTKKTATSLKNSLIRRNNLKGFQLRVSERQA